MMASSLPPMVASQLAQLPFPGAQVERDQLIGLGNADDFRDARQVFKTPAVDWTLVAGDTNGCSRGTGHQMRTQPNFLNHVLQLPSISRAAAPGFFAREENNSGRRRKLAKPPLHP